MNFNHISKKIAEWMGTSWAFVASILLVLVWALTGPFMHYSATWQLIINTSTTVITFWLVFVIQNTQNRDNLALHRKIDELILSIEEANNELVGIEKED